MENLRETGSEYEQKAACFLEERGYRILVRNYRCRVGEIDLVAMHNGYLVFVEVKYRKTVNYGMPVEAVGYKKQRTISKVAQHYIVSHGVGSQIPIRFDVVAVLGDEITVWEHAFEFCG